MTSDGPPVPHLVVASGSPRRHEMLRRLGFDFEIVEPDVDEQLAPGEEAVDAVGRLAAAKAIAGRDLAASVRRSVVLGADTLVELDGEPLGKPTDARDATAMLERLSGRVHRVHTAVALAVAGLGSPTIRTVSTDVEFVPLTARDIVWYVATTEPLDKAGAYGIHARGGAFVKRIAGSYSAVVGLPLAETVALLRAAGLDLPAPPAPPLPSTS